MRHAHLASGVTVAVLMTSAAMSPARLAAATVGDAVLFVDEQTYAIESGESFAATIVLGAPAALVAAAVAGTARIVVTAGAAVVDATGIDDVDGPALDSLEIVGDGMMSRSSIGATGTISFPVGVGTDAATTLDVGGGGIHPVTIEVAAGSDVATTTTFLEVVDPSAPRQPMSIAVAATVTDAEGLQQLVDVAAAVDAPLSVAIPPSLVAQPASGDPGQAFRADELVALPAVPLDPSAVVAVEEGEVFTRLLRDGEDLLSAATPLAAVSRAVWFADRPISAPAAAMLRDLGVRMIVMADEVAAELGVDPDVDAFSVTLGRGDTLPAMTVDPFGAALDGGGAEGSANERAVRLLAGLRLAHGGGSPAGVLLAAPGFAVPNGDVAANLARLVATLPDTSIVAASRLPGIVAGGLPDESAVALPAVAGAALTNRAADIETVRDAAAHAASMLGDSPVPGTWNRRLDALLASDLDDTTAQQRLAEIDAEIDAVLSSIVPPEPFTMTMTGTSNTLRLPIGNTGSEPLLVDVRVRSPKLATDAPSQQVTVPALGSVEVEVPVVARSKGTFTIEVDVRAPDGFQLHAPVVLKGRVTNVSGLSQVVTGGAALVLVSWWYTHLRRQRAERRARRAMIQP